MQQTTPPKSTIAQTIYEVSAFFISGVGLSLEPSVFLACIIFASVGSVIGKNHIEAIKTRRGFWFTLSTGLLFSLAVLLVDESMSASRDWWPDLSPQLLAIGAGFFSPLAVPMLFRMFPKIAERLVGKMLPENKDE